MGVVKQKSFQKIFETVAYGLCMILTKIKTSNFFLKKNSSIESLNIFYFEVDWKSNKGMFSLHGHIFHFS